VLPPKTVQQLPSNPNPKELEAVVAELGTGDELVIAEYDASLTIARLH